MATDGASGATGGDELAGLGTGVVLTSAGCCEEGAGPAPGVIVTVAADGRSGTAGRGPASAGGAVGVALAASAGVSAVGPERSGVPVKEGLPMTRINNTVPKMPMSTSGTTISITNPKTD
jgi:hypothetical protein